jgi:para-nitrobenzyl esterase
MKYVPLFTTLAATICLATAPTMSAPAAEPTGGHAKMLVIRAHPAKGNATLKVTTPAYQNGADIPYENTQYRGNIFPGLNWTAGPAGTKSYVVVMQGVGLKGDGTSVHFTLFNVPANVTSLAVGLSTAPAGATYGVNVHGLKDSYAGPHTHTPATQAYHLQVLALDTTIDTGAKSSFAALEAAMNDHVLASGEVVGLSAKDPTSKD